MERITSCESTLSELITHLPSQFIIGDRVRRIGGAISVPTDIKLIGGGTSGTVRYVGPICKTQEEADRNIIQNQQQQQQQNTCSSTTLSPYASAPSSPALPPSVSQQEMTTAAATSNNATTTTTTYIGVEWDQKVGKNDGTVEGIRYFTCEPGFGSLLLPKNLSKGLPLVALLEARYGSSTIRQEAGTVTTTGNQQNTQTKPMQLGPAIGYRDPQTGAFVKVVNCDCTANEQLGLASTAGGSKLALLFPNLRDLSVAGTLLASWDELRLIVASLPNLEALDVSRNPALGAPTSEKHRCVVTNNNNNNETADTDTAAGAVVSTSVRELRMSDMGLLSPDCVEYILTIFPNLEALFAARNNITLKNHPKRGSQVMSNNNTNSCSNSPMSHSATMMNTITPSTTTPAKNNNNNTNQQEVVQGHAREESTTSILSTKSTNDNTPSHLKYLNIEGNTGIEYFEDVVDLIGLSRCASLTALNVSSTSISDAPHLPPINPELVEKLPNVFFNPSASQSLSSVAAGSGGSSSGNSPSKQNGGGGGDANNNNSTHSSPGSVSEQLTSEVVQPAPPLFPNLVSLYMSKTPVYSWLALSRLMHRAADCINGKIQDVHFSTTAAEEQQQAEQDHTELHHVDDGLSTTADENFYETASSSAFSGADGGCFLPEDFRDRRRLSVAFMPLSVKKFNRSEILSVERSSAVSRSTAVFYQLVRRTEVRNQDDPENAEEIEIVDPKRLGDLPRHLQKLVVKEHIRATTLVSNAGTSNSTANTGVGFIYRPSTIGPRKLVNEVEVTMRCVFAHSKEHLSQLRGEFFRSVLQKSKEDDEQERETNMNAQESQNMNRRNLSAKESGKIRLKVDVRWETQQLEEAVREALGMDSPTVVSNAKKTPVSLFHIDKELMENPGAVAQGLHCKHLARPWEKLYVSKIAENDDLIACVGP